MSSDVDSPHVVHVVSAGTQDVFRRYLDKFGPSIDVADIENSVKTPGYIVSVSSLQKFLVTVTVAFIHTQGDEAIARQYPGRRERALGRRILYTYIQNEIS